MNRYHVRIDGEIMPNSYTYEELLLNGIFDFDDIEIKQVSKSNWTNIRSYYFPEEHENASSNTQKYFIDENGQAQFSKEECRKNRRRDDFTIDEFGQIVSQHNIGGGLNSVSSNSTSSPNRSKESYNTTSDDNKGWKIFFSIVVFVVFIVITCTTGWGSIPAGALGYWIMRSIWGDDL